MRSRAKLTYIRWVCILIPVVSYAQESGYERELGLPFYSEHFAPRDYRAHPQNWCVAQDTRGVVYVGNYDGILAYDGSSWQLIPTLFNTTVRSMAADDDGRVYVGLQGDFGYVTADTLGRLTYASLGRHVLFETDEYWDVWGTHVIGNDVFFQTKTRLIRWDGHSFKIWTTVNGYHTSFSVGDVLYLREKNEGLIKVEGDELIRVPGGEVFANERIFMLEEHPHGGLIIATENKGLFHLADGHSRQLKTEIDDWMSGYRLYHGTSLEGGFYALGFLDGGGLAVIDSNGRLIDALSEGNGLPDGWVNHVFQDRQGGLWLGLNNKGIMRVDFPSALTRYNSNNGLDGVINDIRRVERDIYVATSAGLFRLLPVSEVEERPIFERISGVSAATSILAVQAGILVSTHQGVMYVGRDGDVNEVATGAYFSLVQSENHSEVVFLGSKTGISMLKFDGQYWHQDGELLTLNKEVYSLGEVNERTLWLSTRENEVYRVRLSATTRTVEDLAKFELPGDKISGQIAVTIVEDRAVFASTSGLLLPEEEDGTKRLRLLKEGSGADTLLYYKLMENGDVWKVYPDRVTVSKIVDGEYSVSAPPVLSKLHWRNPVRFTVDSSAIVWISTGSTLVRYDPSLADQSRYEAHFPALLRRITDIDSNHDLHHGAFVGANGELTATQEASLVPTLAFEQNALQFEFTLPSYNDVSGNEFQYYLEGKDKDWSEWISGNSKNYTNLGEGTYRFHIRGRNAQGFVSPESVYAFTVLPPWYRSIWAYSAYFLGLVGLGLFAQRHRRIVAENKKAKEQAKELAKEREVNERLNDLNRRLQQANESLLQADRLKDEFLANTSHELRTPLTGILGCASILREEVTEDQTEFIDMIDENGQRLLHTLDSLLDLARLRAGLMELQCEDLDIGELAFGVARGYVPDVEKKAVNIDVNVHGEVRAWIDEHCLECVLNHLIGNAVKFTDDGQVDVSVKRDVDNIVLAVADTGIGIDEEFLPFLFDEFKQESTGLTRSHEGNGLGLAVTARLVDLMGGEIEVESRKGVGTTFTVYLPVRSAPGTGRGDGQTTSVPKLDVRSPEEESDRAAA